jgi:hypothetical protein
MRFRYLPPPLNIQYWILTQTGTTAVNVNGTLNSPAVGAATSHNRFDSQPHDFVAPILMVRASRRYRRNSN